jgi:RNA polymerase sigma-70 factor (ECF subfamily)
MQDDPHLHQALARRDRAAWAAMYDRHVGTVFGLVYHLVGRDRAVAEDVNQEVWLLAIEQAEQFDPARGEFRDWLLGIARHRALRRRGVRQSARLDEAAWEESDQGLVPMDLVESVERADVVRAALLCLQDDWRAALLDKYTQGISVAQIAARTGRSAKAVESILSRARERLRALLRPYFTNSTV